MSLNWEPRQDQPGNLLRGLLIAAIPSLLLWWLIAMALVAGWEFVHQ